MTGCGQGSCVCLSFLLTDKSFFDTKIRACLQVLVQIFKWLWQMWTKSLSEKMKASIPVQTCPEDCGDIKSVMGLDYQDALQLVSDPGDTFCPWNTGGKRRLSTFKMFTGSCMGKVPTVTNVKTSCPIQIVFEYTQVFCEQVKIMLVWSKSFRAESNSAFHKGNGDNHWAFHLGNSILGFATYLSVGFIRELGSFFLEAVRWMREGNGSSH